MVEETNLEGKIVFKCMKCGWIYRDEESAMKCQQWCEKHDSCDMELTRHSLKMKGGKVHEKT